MWFDYVTNNQMQSPWGTFLQVGDVKDFHTHPYVDNLVWKWSCILNIFSPKLSITWGQLNMMMMCNDYTCESFTYVNEYATKLPRS